ncbi:MAG: proline dehydrogenase, partial [Anaerolineae bacterium]
AFRIQPKDAPLDILRVLAAAICTETSLIISWTRDECSIPLNDQSTHLLPLFHFVHESEDRFIKKVRAGAFERVRQIAEPSETLKAAASESVSSLITAAVLANGRFELLHYVREIALSIDYHRYGNLGLREGEKRKAVL